MAATTPDTYTVIPLGYQTPAEFYAPSYPTPEARQNRTPDYRATLLWNPAVALDERGRAVVEFYPSDSESGYDITVEGVTDDGEIIRADEFIPNNT